MNRNITLDESRFKLLLKEVLTEVLEERKDLFEQVVKEAIEDIGLVKAIAEGDKHDYVTEKSFMNYLDKKIKKKIS